MLLLPAPVAPGPAATLGVQLTPLWAIQSSVQFFWEKGSLRTTDASIEENRKTFIIPLLARYTFTDAASPLQVDVLGGGSWLHLSYRAEYTYLSNSGQVIGESRRRATNGAALTLGPQVRYKLGSNFEAKLSLPINIEIDGRGSFSDRLFLTPQLGAQYVFGK
jgi:hypothetical protein